MITRLDAASARKISAGQVITDVASVVKELLENALDAEATVVTVRLYAYGTETIVVEDNGTGIDLSDVIEDNTNDGKIRECASTPLLACRATTKLLLPSSSGSAAESSIIDYSSVVHRAGQHIEHTHSHAHDASNNTKKDEAESINGTASSTSIDADRSSKHVGPICTSPAVYDARRANSASACVIHVGVTDTLGFRGEALHSLAHVSDVTLSTMHSSTAPRAVRVQYDSATESSTLSFCPLRQHTGTTVTVQKLFRYLPVRQRELMHTRRKQLTRVVALVRQYAVSHPRLRLVMTHQESSERAAPVSLVALTGSGDLQRSVCEAYGGLCLTRMQRVHWWGRFGEMTGLVSKVEVYQKASSSTGTAGSSHAATPRGSANASASVPSSFASQTWMTSARTQAGAPVMGNGGRMNADQQVFSFNGRLVDLPRWAKAIQDAFIAALPDTARRCFVAFFLQCTAPADLVYDVNLTPSKRAVLLSSEEEVVSDLHRVALTHFRSCTGDGGGEQPRATAETRWRGCAAEVNPTSLHSPCAELAQRRSGQAHSSTYTEDEARYNEIRRLARTPVSSTSFPEFVFRPATHTIATSSAHTTPRLDCAEQRLRTSPAEADVGPGCVTAYDRVGDASHTLSLELLQGEELYQTNTPSCRRPGETERTSQRWCVDHCARLSCGTGVRRAEPRGAHATRRSLSSILSDGNSASDDGHGEEDGEDAVCDGMRVASGDKEPAFLPTTRTDTTENGLHPVSDERLGDAGSGLSYPPIPMHRADSHDCDRMASAEEAITGARAVSPTEHIPRPLLVTDASNYPRRDGARVRWRRRADWRRVWDADSRVGRVCDAMSDRECNGGSGADIDAGETHPAHDGKKAIETSRTNVNTDDSNNSEGAGHGDSKQTSRHTPFSALQEQSEDELTLFFHKNSFSAMTVVGQFNHGFIVCVLHGHLFVMDQHASDEKYNYELLMRDYAPVVQTLVVPVAISLEAHEVELALTHAEELRRHGFGLAGAADATKLLVGSIPILPYDTVTANDVYELIQQLVEYGQVARPLRAVWHSLATKACRSSIMIGTPLSMSLMSQVVHRLSTLEQPWNCPHGRPTMRHLGRYRDWLQRTPSALARQAETGGHEDRQTKRQRRRL